MAKKKMNEAEVASLHQLIVAQLQDIYWAEQKMLTDLPGMGEKASSKKLKDAFKKHEKETKVHIERLQQAFTLVGEKAKAKKCEAMAGLAKETEHFIEETPENTSVRDCALIVAAQKTEHYEIATYGCLRTLLRIAGHGEAAILMQTTLTEEHAANDHLTLLAETYINEDAKEESGER